MSLPSPSEHENSTFGGCGLDMFATSKKVQRNETQNDEDSFQQGQPTPEDIVENLIANEMNRLSIKEREKVFDDVHAIATLENENSILIDSCLSDLGRELNNSKHRHMPFGLAQALSREYVSNRDFRLMFVRAARYDPKEAAQRMVQFFELKHSLFGLEKLVKDITLDDLDKADMECLEEGAFRLSPYKDTAGRQIFFSSGTFLKHKSVEQNRLRAQFYILMSAVENVEAQRRGVVGVYYLVDSPAPIKSISGKLRSSLPVHFSALHLCCNDKQIFTMACVGISKLNATSCVRYRTHFGSHVECQNELSTFGIPRHALPVSLAGEMSTSEHLAWLERRRDMEARTKRGETADRATILDDGCSTAIVIEPPRSNDVLFGKGGNIFEHPGNARLRGFVDLYLNQYERISRLEKTAVTGRIFHMVKESSGRFMKQGIGGGWEEVDETTAREKVSHTFRNRRKALKTWTDKYVS